MSVFANAKGMSFEVIVIDNASFDGCMEMIQNEFPLVRFIQSQVNLGFARANNLASEDAIGKVLLFLNPDTEVSGPALQCMLASLESLPDAGSRRSHASEYRRFHTKRAVFNPSPQFSISLSIVTTCEQPFLNGLSGGTERFLRRAVSQSL